MGKKGNKSKFKNSLSLEGKSMLDLAADLNEYKIKYNNEKEQKEDLRKENTMYKFSFGVAICYLFFIALGAHFMHGDYKNGFFAFVSSVVFLSIMGAICIRHGMDKIIDLLTIKSKSE